MTNREDSRKLLATAGLLLTDAMVLQEVIAASYPKVPTLSKLIASENIKKELELSWKYIIDNIDYQPILEIAHGILMNLTASPVLDRQLRSLANLAYDMAASKVLLRHDLFGRIYHQLLLGKLVKYHATFYTSIPAARLLARLLVGLPSPLNMKNIPPKYGKQDLRVIDFACGSGTLLSAVYKELDVKHRIETKKLRINDLHKYLMEDGIWGFDVLHHAVHLASTVLNLNNPVPVERSRLYALRLGQLGNKKWLGSVNFLESSELVPEILLSGQGYVGGGERVSISDVKKETIKLQEFQLCIMNPPFTRSVGGNLLFGSLPQKERRELQKELSRLLHEKNLSGIGQAGLGAVFVFLADTYLAEGGRLGLVLPRAVLSGVSWQKVRERLLDDYHIEYVITSYEPPNGWNFSENTDLSEVLLVVRKTKDKAKKHTIFVNLWKKPSNEIEAIHIGTQLMELYGNAALYDLENSNASPFVLKMNGKKIGEVYSARLTAGDFGTYNFFSQMELNRTVALLKKGFLYLPEEGVINVRIPLTTLSDLRAEIGPDVRQVHDTFGSVSSTTESTYSAFWGYDSTLITTIAQKPNRSLEPKGQQADKARDLWKKRGNLLIVERAWLSTYTAIAAYLKEGVLSNVWWPVKVSEDMAKALAIWLNSTFGILLLLSIAEITRGPWVKFKKDHLWDMPILDVSELKESQRKAMLNLYDKVVGGKKISELEIKSLPEEFTNPYTRRIIDQEISKILGIDSSLDTLYKLLANEPMIKGK